MKHSLIASLISLACLSTTALAQVTVKDAWVRGDYVPLWVEEAQATAGGRLVITPAP